MSQHSSIVDASIAELGLRLEVQIRLQKRGIATIGQLLRYEPGNLHRIYQFGACSSYEVARRLQVHQLRLADRIMGPVLVPPAGDKWVRLPILTSQPSWHLHSELPGVSLDALIGPSWAVLAQAGIVTIGDALALSEWEIYTRVDWSKKPHHNPDRVIRELTKPIYDVGFELRR